MLKSSGFSRRVRRRSGRAVRGGRSTGWARRSLIAAAVAIVAAGAVRLGAASATFWTVSTQADFLKGDAEDVSIDSEGRLFLGPSPSLVAETSAPFLWTAILGADGTLWAGSGNEGQVLKVSKEGKLSVFFDATELEVHALAPAPNGGLYVGTSPDGKIYQVNADGTSRTFFDPDDKYIWSLAVDKSGNVFAATGDKGIIYKITPDGHGTPFYRTNAGNVVALAFTKAGDLIAGTESPGRVFKIDTGGKAFVLLDSPYREIHAVRLADDGTIYAVAVNGTQGGESRATDPLPVEAPPRQPVPSVSTEITAMTVVDNSVGPSPSPMPRVSTKKQGRGAIYRIRPDGLWDAMWDSGEDAPYDIVIEPSGSLLVGTGTEGKIFRVSGDPARATLLARAAARQVTALLREPSGRIIGAASNPGKLFALSPAAARRGTFESDVRDAGTVASWGVIRWRASANSGAVNLFSRSGNTATPDETWSPWSSAYTNAGGEQIVSPTARYLQWRVVLTSSGAEGPVLTSVTTAYLPRNLRPEVSSITVHPSGTVFQRPFSTGETELAGFDDAAADVRFAAQSAAAAASGQPGPGPALGRRIYQKGLQTFVWKADDDNDDRLQFDILYRREGETSWKVLHRGLTDPIFVWDTTSVPDGTYFVKVSASDALSNSPGAALVGELESVSFDIDNTAPRIELQPATRTGARTTITFTVRDDQSSVQRVEYSLDASRWRLAYPKDGIADSRREDFEVRLDEGEAARSVIIRATDAMNNVATGVAEIKR
jgi:WD40 repeat protein